MVHRERILGRQRLHMTCQWLLEPTRPKPPQNSSLFSVSWQHSYLSSLHTMSGYFAYLSCDSLHDMAELETSPLLLWRHM